MKDYTGSKGTSELKYWDINNLYDCAMPQKPPVNKFDSIKDTS